MSLIHQLPASLQCSTATQAPSLLPEFQQLELQQQQQTYNKGRIGAGLKDLLHWSVMSACSRFWI